VAGDGFGIENLPYGIVRPRAGGDPRPAVRFGDAAVDLRALDLHPALGAPTLNAFLAAGPEVWSRTRARIAELLRAGGAPLVPLDALDVLLPVAIGDYVDGYASLEHATNVGRLFRPDGEPLTPNWRHMPIAYHGRAGTVAVSGTPVRRPHGQLERPGGPPAFGPEPRLDVEVELGFITGDGPVFGCVLVNDWSAREIQRWEYRPLGPFGGKSFLTSISPWVVPLEALPRVPGPAQEPEPLPYLRAEQPRAFDVELELEVAGAVVSRTNARHLYWSIEQQLAQATVTGATVRAGDLFATGTISGPEPGSEGSLLERGGPFLADGDEVVIRGRAGPVSLGEVRGTIVP
jgi:fumarylacetoacetase